MSDPIRARLRRAIPTPAKRMIQSVRRMVGVQPIDDAVLAQYQFAADPEPRSRISFVIPNLSDSEAFGGVTTGIDLVLSLARRLNATTPIDLRLILTDYDQSTNTKIFTARATEAGFAAADITVQKISGAADTIGTRSSELFITYNWWTTLNIAPLTGEQSRHFRQPQKPLVYLIQEYEPVIFPFSSAHLLAREAYDTPERLWGVFNSSNLKSYFDLQGHEVERGWVLEPVVNDRLRPFLASAESSERKRQILVYGRPGVNRNCFPALVRGLREWVRSHPEQFDWEVVSAGTPHDPVPIGDGREIRSLGKLSLEQYAQLLLESSVGVSLMASPHPSYPPLEMAHFGVRVVTNTYTCKDLAGYHPNISSLRSIAANALSQGIANACRVAGTPTGAEANPLFVRDEKYPFLPELADAVAAELGQPSS